MLTWRLGAGCKLPYTMKWPSLRTAQVAPVVTSCEYSNVSLDPRCSRPEVPPPANPINGPHASDLRSSSQIEPASLSFVQTFGKLGIPVVLMVLVSIAWTAWLIVLAAAPNQTANYLMGTTEFDDGNFWMIIDPEPVFMAVSVVCLGVLVATYVSVVIKMAARRNVDFTRSLLYRLLAARLSRMSSKVSSRFRLPRGSSEFWKELNDFEGRKRKIFVRSMTAVLSRALASLTSSLCGRMPSTSLSTWLFKQLRSIDC
jgi:hypothetical protein